MNMSLPICLPEQLKIVCLFKGAADTLGTATYSDIISCKNAHKVWILLSHFGTNNTDVAGIGLYETTAVGTTGAAVTATVPMWYISAASYLTDDTWTKVATEAATFTSPASVDGIDPATKGQTSLLIEWDPAKHTAGYDCIALRCTGGHASNFMDVWAFIAERFHEASPPSAIVD
jgi:hypothetical protein